VWYIREVLLSVVIPTKNRPSTLYYAVCAALAIPSKDLEVVVQDCSDNNTSQDVLAPFIGDARLRYARSDGTPSMTQNWNFAFERLRGEYAIVLGDDDAVGSEVVNAARWARANGVDAIADQRISYLWPNYQLRDAAGTVRVSRHTGQITYADASKVLETTLRSYPIGTTLLPHIYHCLVRMDLMREIKSRAGAFFDSMAPDYYSTIALSCIAQQFARVDYPLCASGASAAANAGRVHVGKDYLHALEYMLSDWAPYVPPFYTMQTAIVDATIKGLSHMGRQDLIPSLDYSSFYAECLIQQPGKAPAIIGELRRLAREHPTLARRIYSRLPVRMAQMGARRLRHVVGRQVAASSLKKLTSRLRNDDYDVLPASNIIEALELSQQVLRSRGIRSPFASDPATQAGN
jgi:hypothetical protein